MVNAWFLLVAFFVGVYVGILMIALCSMNKD